MYNILYTVHTGVEERIERYVSDNRSETGNS